MAAGGAPTDRNSLIGATFASNKDTAPETPGAQRRDRRPSTPAGSRGRVAPKVEITRGARTAAAAVMVEARAGTTGIARELIRMPTVTGESRGW